MDLLCRTSLANSLRAAFSVRLDSSDPTVWFVRRLELDLACNLDASDAELAQLLINVLAEALRSALFRGASGDTDIAVRFSSKAEYLAAFCFDLADGTARGLWYYADFEPLFALPDGTIILQTLRKHPDLAEEILLVLARSGRWNTVRSRLSSAQCQQLLALLQTAGPSDAVSPVRLLQAWRECGQPRRTAPQDLLNFYLAGRVSCAASPGLLWQLCPALLQYLEWWDHSNIRQSGAASPLFIRLVELLGFSEAQEVCAACMAAAPGHDQPDSACRSLPSSLAGLFLVWSAFVSTDVSPLLSDQNLLRYLLAMRLAGRHRAGTAEVDAIPQLLADLRYAPNQDQLVQLSPEAELQMRLFSTILEYQHRRRWLCGRVLLRRIALPGCGRRILLFQDAQSAAWAFAADGICSEAEAIQKLRAMWPASEHLTVIVCTDDATDSLPDTVPGVSLLRADATELSGSSSTVSEQSPKLRGLETDLAFLSSRYLLPLGTELLVLLLSRLSLQAFAARLPGFSRSSSKWLSSNLLETAGVLLWLEDGVIEVQLQPPPLHLVLRMGGWDSDSFRLHSGQQVRFGLASS